MKQKILVFLTVTFMKLLRWSYRFELHGDTPTPHLLAFWHKDILTSFFANNRKPYSVLISNSKDGDFATRVIEAFGHSGIRGSSSKNGKEAMHTIIDAMKKGKLNVGITIDGPRGPALTPKFGIFEISRQTQVPIAPVIIVNESKFIFKKAWDKFELPYPFSKIHAYYGETFVVPENTAKEDYPIFAEKLKKIMLAKR